MQGQGRGAAALVLLLVMGLAPAHAAPADPLRIVMVDLVGLPEAVAEPAVRELRAALSQAGIDVEIRAALPGDEFADDEDDFLLVIVPQPAPVRSGRRSVLGSVPRATPPRPTAWIHFATVLDTLGLPRRPQRRVATRATEHGPGHGARGRPRGGPPDRPSGAARPVGPDGGVARSCRPHLPHDQRRPAYTRGRTREPGLPAGGRDWLRHIGRRKRRCCRAPLRRRDRPPIRSEGRRAGPPAWRAGPGPSRPRDPWRATPPPPRPEWRDRAARLP